MPPSIRVSAILPTTIRAVDRARSNATVLETGRDFRSGEIDGGHLQTDRLATGTAVPLRDREGLPDGPLLLINGKTENMPVPAPIDIDPFGADAAFVIEFK